MEAVVAGILAGLKTTLGFFWESLFGLIFGFLVSAIVQVVATPRDMERWLGPNARGIASGTAFGIVSSACSYGAAAAARGLYNRGADLRSIFAFLISSTNMNVAIVILFWALLGWKFAFAEFFGGLIIIAIVVTGISLLFSPGELRRMREQPIESAGTRTDLVSECLIRGMEGEPEHAVTLGGVTYLACGQNHENALRAQGGPQSAGARSLRSPQTWHAIWEVLAGDVGMLRNDIIMGYLIAGFAAALVPAQWLAGALSAVGHVPVVGYVLLLLFGLLLAVLTFVCSMGNVPVARFLAMAGIPLGANTAFIYGDLLVLPLIGIYRKTFPPKVVWSFIALFAVGALVAGAVMDVAIGRGFGGVTIMGSMQFNDRFTIVSNVLGIVALAAAWALARAGKLRSAAAV